MVTEACKSKETPKKFQWEDVTSTTPEVPSVELPLFTPVPPIDVDRRHFLAVVTNLRTGEWGGGARVLPYVVVTADFIKWEEPSDVEVRYIDDHDLPMLLTIELLTFYESSKDNMFVIVTGKRPEGNLPVILHTIPIASRTMTLTTVKCFVYTIDRKMQTTKYTVRLIKNTWYCSKRRTCARPDWDYCFHPEGSLLVCNGRLAGIRIDTSPCVSWDSYYVFANVRFADYWAAEKMKRYYGEYDIVGEPYFLYSIDTPSEVTIQQMHGLGDSRDTPGGVLDEGKIAGEHLEEVLKRLKNGKAPGDDKLTTGQVLPSLGTS
ncbi:hypothetical protein Trydic_g14534 [Trypoxylus dichotomus]